MVGVREASRTVTLLVNDSSTILTRIVIYKKKWRTSKNNPIIVSDICEKQIKCLAMKVYQNSGHTAGSSTRIQIVMKIKFKIPVINCLLSICFFSFVFCHLMCVVIVFHYWLWFHFWKAFPIVIVIPRNAELDDCVTKWLHTMTTWRYGCAKTAFYVSLGLRFYELFACSDYRPSVERLRSRFVGCYSDRKFRARRSVA